jgi:branched-chain amino acid transport system substrate-binding protein
MLFEDSVNPQTGLAKAERLAQRDKVACIVGEINSASALAIGQVVQREKILFINTGANSDALRGSDCRRYMFHTESPELDDGADRWPRDPRGGLVRGKKYYALTADYAFGHDLLRVAKKFMGENGGTVAGEDLVPTELTDFSPFLLKLRQARPDVVIATSRARRSPTSSSSTASIGLRFPIAGFGFDTALAWGAGPGNFLGTWPVVWHHLIQSRLQGLRTAAFRAKAGKPPENQGWSDYTAMRVIAQSMNELKSGCDQGGRASGEGCRSSTSSRRARAISVQARPPADDGGTPSPRCRRARCEPLGHLQLLPPFRRRARALEAIAATPEENACTFPS